MKKIILAGMLVAFSSVAVLADAVSDKLKALDARMSSQVQQQKTALWLEPQSPDNLYPNYEKYLLRGVSVDKEGIFGLQDAPMVVYIKPNGKLNKDTALEVLKRLYAAVAPGGQWPLLCGKDVGQEVFSGFITRQESALQQGKMPETAFFVTEGFSVNTSQGMPSFVLSGIFVGDNKNLKKAKLLKEKDWAAARPWAKLLGQAASSSDKDLENLHRITWQCFSDPRFFVFY